jgi:hypothetical protein
MNSSTFIKKHDISNHDVAQMQKHGKSVADIIRNYELLKEMSGKNKNFVSCENPLVEKDVVRLSSQELAESEQRYDTEINVIHPSKFIPASGYASRMFGYLERYLHTESVSESDNAKILTTLRGMDDRIAGPKFSFINKLRDSLHLKGFSINQLIDDSMNGDRESLGLIIKELLYEKGMNFKSLPKALIPFHSYDGEPVIALKEHIEEVWRSGKSKLCIAVSPVHERQFHEAIDDIKTGCPHLAEVEIDISFQRPETDSIAINPETAEIIRDKDGNVSFFPAGHGALLLNIHEVCHIKNVDNLPFGEDGQRVLSTYHKAMVCKLASLKRMIAGTIEAIDDNGSTPQTLNETIIKFASMKFHLFLDFQKYNGADFMLKKAMLREALNRPICICGVVRNNGEPGGGPFFYTVDNIQISSIIERDEIAPAQHDILLKGEFFNPVEILFDPTDYKGKLFNDLTRFEDNRRYIIVKKLFDGKPTVRLEYPGLWNGRMAKCNKMWIVLPSDTFAPVKELVDLLNKQHQAHAHDESNLLNSNHHH